MSEFTHLHLHTQYSILDGAANIRKLIARAKELKMDSLAITDHGNLFGVLEFFNEARSNDIKPIIGCEVYVADRGIEFKTSKQDRSGHHLILLAKNLEGYRNLSRLSSLGYLKGFYYTPRIDKKMLRQYSKGLIASSACLGGEVPTAIMNGGAEKAEEVLKEYLDIFGEDFYLELMDHGLPEQKSVNPVLAELAQKYKLKLIATNDVHFINEGDYEAHHILICLNTGKDVDDQKGMHYTGKEFLRSADEMKALFGDYPDAISNTREIVDKIEDFDIRTKKVILPRFPRPEKFKSEDDYLRHLTYEGARRLYGDITDEIRERLDKELKIISDMGFPGYFLIVQDFINEARRQGVMVGPGRGSAAGSAVAYCTGITNIDPIGYNLLFERFLNPERVTMPDIDVDFDDEGREKVMEYVVDKYGESHVAQIITFGTMAARSAIRDVARVLRLPLPDADRIAKLVPEKPGTLLKKAIGEVPELKTIRKNGEELERKTLDFAETLEGSARHTGVHACGVIIGPDDLIDHVPLSTAKDSKLPVTQYDGKLVESVGMLKMDFLGLKTLSIIKDALDNVYLRHKKKIDIDTIPLDDKKTYELYQRGDTIGTFQFESTKMREHLRELKPTNLEDLIAMNALYRPGPMDFIPTFIKRKHGKEQVKYPHEMLEKILEPTFGIMVYQEQIMQAAQIMGGFSLGKADLLRRAMGKKKMDIMNQQKKEFIKGAEEKGIGKEKAAEVFDTMSEFAKYGFNRSHSAAYSVIAYQTAYLKAHYTAEYMAAVLTHNLNDIKKITFFIDECKRHNIPVLGPDINESYKNFVVNDKGEVRFGMAAIKGVGENAVEDIIRERDANGPFGNIFDFAKRVNLRSVNKRCMEALAMAGAFDNFENTHRAQYFYRENSDDTIFLEKVIKHATKVVESENASQASLFGDMDVIEISDPELPECRPLTKMDQLKLEREVTGFYISGHPLEDYKQEIEHFTTITIAELKENLKKHKGKNLKIPGFVTEVAHKTTRNGKPFARFVVEDFTDSIELAVFSEDYLRVKHFLNDGYSLLISINVKPHYKNPDQLETRVGQVMLLTEVMDKLAKNLTVQLPLSALDQSFIDEVEDVLKANPGNCKLKFRIADSDNITIDLPARGRKIDCRKMLEFVQNSEGMSFIVNEMG